MPITVIELFDSRSLKASMKGPTAKFKYAAYGSMEVEDVRAAVRAAAPSRHPDYPFLWLDTISLDHQGGNVWFADVDYTVVEGQQIGETPSEDAGSQHPNPPAETDTLGPEFSFDTTGGTETRYKSITTMASKSTSGTPPNFAKSINVSQDGDVKGVEVPAPKFEWSFTAHFPVVTHKYLDRLKVMTGTINKRKFFGRYAAECQFLGATGSWRQGNAWTLTFKFRDSPTMGEHAWKQKYLPGAIPPNVTANTALQKPQRLFQDSLLDSVTDNDSNKIKRGWDYVWILYETSTSNGRKVTVPFAAYFEKIFYEVDFYWLGIGGAAVPPSNDLTPPEDSTLS